MSEKIQLKNVHGDVLFEHEQENNTTKETVLAAIKEGVSLSGLYLYSEDLSGVNLSGVDFSNAVFRYVNFNFSCLSGANLTGSYLYSVNLRYVNFKDADLNYATVSKCSIIGAILNEAENVPYFPLDCPSDGSFIAWKTVKGFNSDEKYIIKLEIPEDARRSSGTTNGCRCDKAKVLDIVNLTSGEHITEVTNTEFKPHLTYKVGEMVYPDSFDENRWNECSHGIHFFIDKKDAIDY